MPPGPTQRSLLFLFAISGFSGLIYESVWSHYLKLFLGHAAYAQALVLIIFMGGMAVGAWLASRVVHRIPNLLMGYAIVEGIIGLFGILFHSLFDGVMIWSFTRIIPGLDGPLTVHLFKTLTAALLILPQSILLGMTFPLMAGGYIRRFREAHGRSIALLYFANSLGATLALLVTSFYLIGHLGLPGTILTAGLINVLLALVVYGLCRQDPAGPVPVHPLAGRDMRPWLLLGASFFTGMASFIYEVAWIRMLSMVLGASTHAFELMLSAFITGLAIGGYWIRRHIDTIENPLRLAGVIQIVMGLLAFSTLYLYDYSFELMSFLLAGLDRSIQGYALFNLASHAIALLIMLPATICAGMTLPLFTSILLGRGTGEKSIGLIYSSNTLGAISGVLYTVYIGMPLTGLKGAIIAGALLDVVVGVILLQHAAVRLLSRKGLAVLALTGAVFVWTATVFDLNTRRMASGVFRHGYARLGENSDVLFHKDGRTASISVASNGKVNLISTNGKPDASITMVSDVEPTLDEVTMILLAALPLAVHPEARTIANIGMGSGLTAHAALVSPRIERIDTIEIEPAMVEGARLFGDKTRRAFEDPRSHIHIDDARTFFSTTRHKYDLIISEPSNPWVSGVSSLFTEEFYRSIPASLEPGGFFVQWIHTYEFHMDLLMSTLKSLASVFPYYSVYFTDSGNLILVASPDQPVPVPDDSLMTIPGMAEQLAHIHLLSMRDLELRFLGDQTLYNPYVAQYPVPANSDYFPVLDDRAPRHRFLRDNVEGLLDVRLGNVPVLDLLYDRHYAPGSRIGISHYHAATVVRAEEAYRVLDIFRNGPGPDGDLAYYGYIEHLLNQADSCLTPVAPQLWNEAAFLVVSKTVAWLSPDEIDEIAGRVLPECLRHARQADSRTDFIDLYQALSRRDHAGIARLARRLIDGGEFSQANQRRFLYLALITALVALNEPEPAAALWSPQVAELFLQNGVLSLDIKLLLARIDTLIAARP